MVGCWLPGVGFPDSRGSSDTTCHLLLSSLLARLPLNGASAGPISLAPAPVKFQVLAPVDLPCEGAVSGLSVLVNVAV